MKRPKTKATKSLMDTMQELGQKYGVKVTDMSGRGVRGIGFLGGVKAKRKNGVLSVIDSMAMSAPTPE
jgi:hypothetical protein